jgi:TPR repeat protein
VDPRVANGNDPGSHPSIIKFSDHFDPLDDIGSREYGATGPAGPVEYDTATVSAGGEGSAELYAYEQRRYSLILREALQAMRGRRYDTAKKLFLRCSDERKKPMELIGPGTGLVRSSSSNDPSDVMGEKQFRTGVQPNPDYTETPNSQSIYDPYCVNKVGELHLAGTLFPKNYYRAIEMFVEAAALGNEEAQYNLGILFAAAVEDDPHYAILHRTVMRGHGMEPGYGGEGAAGDALDGQGSGADQNGLVPAGYQAQPVANSEALSILYLYAASTAGHPGALMAMAHRHDQGLGVPKICSTAALNYIEVAKSITEIYSSGMPQAVELIRLNLDYKKVKITFDSGKRLY